MQASGLSQRAFAIEQGFLVRQIGYWIRRFAGAQALPPTMFPVRVAPAVATASAISLRGDHGWTLALSGDVTASWLAELLHAL